MTNHAGSPQNLRYATTNYGQPPTWVLDHIDEHIIYDADAGKLFWGANAPGTRNPPMSEVGYKRPDGYRTTRIKGKTYMCSRIAWYLHTGKWPVRAMGFADSNTGNMRPDNMWEMGTEPPAAFIDRVRDHAAGIAEAQPLTPDQILAFDATNRSRYIVADAEMGVDVSDEYMDQIHHYLGNLGVEGAAAMANEDAAALVLALG
jgi:hypothetical protein